MRLFRVLPTLSLLFGACVDSRQPAAHLLDARDLLDACASVNTELVVPDLLGNQTPVGVIGQFNTLNRSQEPFIVILTDTCLCLSGLSIFLKTNEAAIMAVTITKNKSQPTS